MFSPSSSHQPGNSDKVEGIGSLVAGYAQSFYHHFSGSWGRGPHEGSVDVEGCIEPVVVGQGDGVKALEDIFHPREEGGGLLKGRQVKGDKRPDGGTSHGTRRVVPTG